MAIWMQILIGAALLLIFARVCTVVIAREWFRAKRRHIQDVMQDCEQPNGGEG